MTYFKQSRENFRRYLRRDDGSVLILFGLVLMSLLGIGGIALDAARALSVQQSLQDDLDRTALFLGKQFAANADNGGGDDDDDEKGFDPVSAAQTFIDGLKRQKHTTATAKIVSATEEDGVVKARATVAVPTALLKLFGKPTLSVDVAAEVEIGEQPVEVVLVLDNTRSMEGDRMATLRTAAKDLIDAAFGVPNASAFVKMGIVPFSRYVNVGLGQRDANWIEVPDDFTTPDPACDWDSSAKLVPGSCSMQETNYEQDDRTFTSTRNVCTFEFPTWTGQCNATNEFKWSGCVGSRMHPLDVRDEQYSAKIPGLLNQGCGAELAPLQSNASTLKAKIDDLYVDGDTYLPAGLMWGWRVLSPDAPYTQGAKYNAKVEGKRVRKILVLMTDGENSVSATPPHHWGSDVAEANDRTRMACTNIKAAGVEVFTVAFEVTDATVKTVLQNCASSSSNYFDATNSEALKMSFQAIADAFAPLRLTR